MMISTLLSSSFGSDVRSRGISYFRSRAVRIVQGTPTEVWANVQGSHLYEVSLVLEDYELRISCTCPYFGDYGTGCKHLWATILTAEQQGYLSALVGRRDIQVVGNDVEDFLQDDEEVFVESEEEWTGPPPPQAAYPPPKPTPPRKQRPAAWNQFFSRIKQSLQHRPQSDHRHQWPEGRQLLYVIDGPASLTARAVVLDLAFQERKKDGDWSKPKFHSISQEQAEQVRAEADAPIMALLFGSKKSDAYGYGYGYSYGIGTHTATRFQLSPAMCRSLLPLMGRTGQLFGRFSLVKEEIQPLVWDDGPPWQFRLHVQTDAKGKTYQVTGWLHRHEERQPLTQPRYLLPGSLVLWEDRAALLDDGGAPALLTALQKETALRVPAGKVNEFLRDLYMLPQLPPLELPAELRVTEEPMTPRPRIFIKAGAKWASWARDLLHADLSFEYAGQRIASKSEDRGVFVEAERRLILRDKTVEQAAFQLLLQLGFREPKHSYSSTEKHDFDLTPRHLARVVRALLQANWLVEAEGKLYRQAGAIHIDVTTGIDWFDLEGKVEFGDQTASLPRLLQALKRGENTVKLDDGTVGMLPEDWLKKYGMLAGLGTAEKDHLRFSRNQAGLLDALLATMPDVSLDQSFRQAAEELRRFEGIKAVDPPSEFVGALRGYQREGLGWLYFLERFGFGGCLADDMGLGKTVQVLALLAGRARKPDQANGQASAPSLIVVPKSLVFNWKQEAARFAPKLRILDHTGTARLKATEHFADWDIVITTYGTLRRDVLLFKDAAFDYCILDEAQAVKNASTDQAKAVRLLAAKHRLVLSGTPVENHLGELWSLFEFLNPGMLGHASLFKMAGGAARNPDPATREVLAKGLRPFILRRTKKEVAKDLPDKTEQTLFCDLEAEQRKLYDELREHYRRALLKTVDSIGMNRAKIQVLEALLRLRQAACHPGLLDKTKTMDASAKLEVLIPALQEAWEGGQKTLVFSQFTSFLSIVGDHLDREGLTYLYLDGKTRNRGAIVERFQTDPECKLFLISLKAGGVGLNLTAAEYVFLLDPWWNPAVEAQAIDRTHRIGQSKPVFAYRLIARDTVEEKVLELQKTKRDLADAILNANNSVIGDLKREDLEMLLS